MSGLSNSLELPIGNLDLTLLWPFVKVLMTKINIINLMINNDISYEGIFSEQKDSVFA